MGKMKDNLETSIGGEVPTNGASDVFMQCVPYRVEVSIKGDADLLFHRWNCEEIEAKSKSAKGSVSKKTDDLETYVYRTENGDLALPGEYFRQSIITAAKNKQDPRSPRKSAMDLYKASVVSLTQYASLGTAHWDYEDKRRVVIQRSGINRTRPAMKSGWESTFILLINTPEYIHESDLHSVISDAGRLVGVGDFRPSYGRFHITHYEVLNS
jgi:hypothetical protein